MTDSRLGRLYIDGKWVSASSEAFADVIDPATERALGQVALASEADVHRAVQAARRAFDSFAATSLRERIALLDRIIARYESRLDTMAITISDEMGAPRWLARKAQATSGLHNLKAARVAADRFAFERRHGETTIYGEPIGVCGLITPWNWPINQITVKVAPAIVSGCTMVLKPSEIAPFNAVLFTEILEEAGVPPGVFNLVPGEGPVAGAALAAHPEVDLVSFTGSTRAGIAVGTAAAVTVKRVCQELGGKSAHVLLEDADMAEAVRFGVEYCFHNSGQSCAAPTRMLVPRSRYREVVDLAGAAAEDVQIGNPDAEAPALGPVVSEAQYERVQRHIAKGVEEGATLLVGGKGRPEGFERGYYVKPTLFADVRNDMAIAREEIFGPVLSLLPYATVEEAIAIANDSEYGLSGYVSGPPEKAREVAQKLRTGSVHINGAGIDFEAPFGGYKRSGNGRERGVYGLAEFVELKAVMG